jgi:hypothetical protein
MRTWALACERMHARVTHKGAGVGAGLADLFPSGRNPARFFAGVATPPRAGSRRLNPPHHQIIPVHHLRAAAEPEERENVGGGAAFDLECVLRVIGDEAATDL